MLLTTAGGFLALGRSTEEMSIGPHPYRFHRHSRIDETVVPNGTWWTSRDEDITIIATITTYRHFDRRRHRQHHHFLLAQVFVFLCGTAKPRRWPSFPRKECSNSTLCASNLVVRLMLLQTIYIPSVYTPISTYIRSVGSNQRVCIYTIVAVQDSSGRTVYPNLRCCFLERTAMFSYSAPFCLSFCKIFRRPDRGSSATHWGQALSDTWWPWVGGNWEWNEVERIDAKAI